MRVGSAPGVEEERHQTGRGEGDGHGDGQAHLAPGSAGRPEQEEEDRGPNQIELLFNGQRPGVLQGRGRGELGEVRLVGVNGVPVAHVEQRGQGVAPQRRQVDQPVGAAAAELGVDDHVDPDAGHHQEEGREETLGPAPPEGGQVQRRRRHPFLEQQRGDEEAREDEEEVDTEVAA